jgi:hypothetical protein
MIDPKSLGTDEANIMDHTDGVVDDAEQLGNSKLYWRKGTICDYTYNLACRSKRQFRILLLHYIGIVLN